MKTKIPVNFPALQKGLSPFFTNKYIVNVFSVKMGYLGAQVEQSQLAVLDFIGSMLLFDTSLEIGKVGESSSKFIRMKGFFSFC